MSWTFHQTLRCLMALCLLAGSGLGGLPSVAALDFAELWETGPFPASRARSATEAEGERSSRPLETDRNAFTPATTVVGRGLTVIESSYSFIDNRGTIPDTSSLPELLTRFGVTDRLELRLGWNFETGGGGGISGSDAPGIGEETSQRTEESRLLYGFKAQITEQEGWKPESVVIVQAQTPSSGPNTATQLILTSACGWKLTEIWRLDCSFRYADSSKEHDRFNQWAPSAVLRGELTERLEMHAEYFGIFSNGLENNLAASYLGPGLHYSITEDFEISSRLGWGVTPDAANCFVNFGGGYRF